MVSGEAAFGTPRIRYKWTVPVSMSEVPASMISDMLLPRSGGEYCFARLISSWMVRLDRFLISAGCEQGEEREEEREKEQVGRVLTGQDRGVVWWR